MLPEDVEFMPTGESPLKFHEGFFERTLPYLWRIQVPSGKRTPWIPSCVPRGINYRYLSPHDDTKHAV